MGEGEISSFIYLPLGGSPKYDTEEFESFQLVLPGGRAEPAVTVGVKTGGSRVGGPELCV